MSSYSNGAQIELTGQSLLLEERLRPITAELNAYPLRVNPAVWRENLAKVEHIAGSLTEYCRYLTKDDTFRPNSPADCRRALGTEESDKDTLTALANAGNVLAESILDARSAIAVQSQLRKWGQIATFGLVQPRWDSLGTPHGRYTSEGPCLNNRVKPIRATIEPDPGFTFLSTDLSCAEYVVWTSMSGDLALSELFLSGKDFHEEMASTVLSLVPDWDLRGVELRQAGKTINFSVLYRMTPYTLSIKLGCSLQVATKIIRNYYKRAKTGIKFIRHVLSDARELGFVETYYGRRRFCFDLQNGLGDRERHEQEKTVWSHVNAGTAAELVKFKQLATWAELRRQGLSADHVRLSLNMYDGLIWSVRDNILKDAQPIIESIWNQRVKGFLPFRSKITKGGNWGEL